MRNKRLEKQKSKDLKRERYNKFLNLYPDNRYTYECSSEKTNYLWDSKNLLIFFDGKFHCMLCNESLYIETGSYEEYIADVSDIKCNVHCFKCGIYFKIGCICKEEGDNIWYYPHYPFKYEYMNEEFIFCGIPDSRCFHLSCISIMEIICPNNCNVKI